MSPKRHEQTLLNFCYVGIVWRASKRPSIHFAKIAKEKSLDSKYGEYTLHWYSQSPIIMSWYSKGNTPLLCQRMSAELQEHYQSKKFEKFLSICVNQNNNHWEYSAPENIKSAVSYKAQRFLKLHWLASGYGCTNYLPLAKHAITTSFCLGRLKK